MEATDKPQAPFKPGPEHVPYAFVMAHMRTMLHMKIVRAYLDQGFDPDEADIGILRELILPDVVPALMGYEPALIHSTGYPIDLVVAAAVRKFVADRQSQNSQANHDG